MKMKLFNTALFLMLFTIILQGYSQQKKYTISGYVKEKGSGELLIGVNVYSPKLKLGCVTNKYGFYSFTLPADSVELMYSYIGYAADKQTFLLDKDKELNIELETTINLKELVVSEKPQKISESSQMSVIQIPVKQISQIPAIFGEKDVLKVLQLMPGVQKGSEGTNGIYVRGGGPDQNLIILDDATVYNVNHLFGFFSVFNGDALKSIELIKGGFPARYGGRLSSVIDMNMKDGNKQKITGSAGIGYIASRLMLEGPIIKNKCSFMISARRTYLDALTTPVMRFLSRKFSNKELTMSLGYFFYDYNAKVNYDFGRKNKVYLSGYFGKDKFFFMMKNLKTNMKNSSYIQWGNSTATARWNHLYNNKLFSNTSFIISNYAFNPHFEFITESTNKYMFDYKSIIRDYSLKHDIEYIPNPVHTVRGGFVSTYHTFIPQAIVIMAEKYDIDYEKVKKYNVFENGIYIEDNIVISNFRINPGIRISQYISGKKIYTNPEPRFSGSYLIWKNFSYKASFSMMNQGIHLLSNTGVGLPTDLWVPCTENVSPQKSWLIATGLAKDFEKHNFTCSLEGYYKKSDKVIGYKEGASFLDVDVDNLFEENTSSTTNAVDNSWENKITTGQCWSYGTELFIQKQKGVISGWLGYTLSWTKLQFDDINFGKKFYAKYDRRHDVSLVLIYEPSERITYSFTWVYGTGSAVSLPYASYNVPSNLLSNSYNSVYNFQYYGEKNSFRMAPYHRADIGVQYHKKKKHWIRTWEFSIYNAYNRFNPYCYIPLPNDNNEIRLVQVTVFPFLPSVSYSIKF